MSYLIKANQDDSHQSVSAAILAVWPFTNRDTFNLRFDGNYSQAMATDKAQVIVSDILSAKVNSTKGDFMSTADIFLSSGDLNYTSLFASGDHAMLWMVNNVTDFQKVTKALLAGSAANYFTSGLKLVGKVNSVREVFKTMPDGKKQLRYLVTLKAFSEFGTNVYYNPHLTNITGEDKQPIESSVYSMSSQWQSIFVNAATGNHITNPNNIGKIVGLFIKVFLGDGPEPNFRSSQGIITSPNAAMLIPAPVVKTLGLPTHKQENAAGNKYSDVLQAIIGVQKYSKASSNEPLYKQFIPSNYDSSSFAGTLQIQLNDPVLGTYITPPENFNNVTIWQLLSAHLNPMLNEMFCSLKTSTANGRILPNFVLRQIPFSKDPRSTTGRDFNITTFKSLPRWKIDPSYPITEYNLGTSDAARFNFYQYYGQTLEFENNAFSAQQQQAANQNLVMDPFDIARSGLRSHLAQTTADVTGSNDSTTDISLYAAISSDFYINGQYKYNGTLMTAGIQEPISIGDNLQFDNKVLHIEALEHQFSVSPDGKKSFFTTIGLSHGLLVSGDLPTQDAKIRSQKSGQFLPAYSDEEVYADGTLIASSAEGRSTKIDPNPLPAKPKFDTSPASELSSKIEDLQKKMGIT